MSKMYYAENPDAAHDVHELRVELLGQKMTFLTDAGKSQQQVIDEITGQLHLFDNE